MAYSNVDLAILKATDRFAMIKDITITGIGNSTNSFWKLKDTAGDETYENRIDGTNTTKMDINISSAKIGKITGVSSWLGYHTTYFRTDLGLTSGWAGYLDSKHARVPEYFAQVYTDSYGSSLPARNIAAQQESVDNILGTFSYTQTVTASTDIDVLPTTVSATRLGVIVTETINDSGSNPLAFSVTVTDGTNTYTYNLLVADDSAIGSGYGDTSGTDFFDIFGVNKKVYAVLGYTGTQGANQTPSAITHASTTSVLTLPTTAGFFVNQYVLVCNAPLNTESNTTIKEYVKITAKDSTTLTVQKLVNRASGEFNTDHLSNIRVYPCWTGVTEIAPTSVTQPSNSGKVKICPVNDRTPNL